ncbi:peptide ABC transporter substrate-binding protein, partial [Psittacicella gerlachiana]
ALDDFTLEVKLESPTPWLTQVLSYGVTGPLRQDVIEKHGDAWVRPENIVSNVPYKLVRYAVNDEITLQKVESYWDAKNVTLTDIRFVFISDPNTAYYQYVAGELLFTGIPIQLKEQILKQRPEEVRLSPALSASYLDFQYNYEPFQDVRVRRAIALLTNNKFIIDNIYSAGTPTSIFVPTYVQDGQLATPADYWDKTMQERQAEAVKLLTAAGFSKANPLKVELTYSSNRLTQRVFIALQNQWDRGSGGLVKLTGNANEWKTYLDKIKSRNYQIRLGGWGADYDQASTFYNILTCNNTANYSGYCNQDYDRYVKEANVEPDATKRAELYAKANKVLQESQGNIPFNWASVYALVSPALGGYNEKNEERYYRDYYIIAGKAVKK